jgi:RNA polymerase sigma-70 factor (ECF subfamily)
MESEETEKQVQAALQSLPENQRAAIILKIYEDRPYSEIAAMIGVSISSVESLLFRARQELKKKLAPR